VTRRAEADAGAGPALVVLGVHLASEAYPSVAHRVRVLRESPELRTREINHPLAEPLSRGRRGSGVGRPLRVAAAGLRLLVSHLRVVLDFLRAGGADAVYVPYPSIGVLCLLSLLPTRRRPRAVACDAFISLYDTIVRDRKLIRAGSPLAGLLRRLEARAYRFADTVIVDTPFNAECMARDFGIARERFAAIPLPIDEHAYAPRPYRPRGGVCTVLFVGTFVPLQGVEVVARAATLLSDDASVRFRIIGDGQTADRVAEVLAASPSRRCEWDRAWKSADELAEAIGDADICLGIFGEGDKAQRVWPLKNYAAMAVGRPLVTGDTRCARAIAAESREPPFVTVPVGDPFALADAVRALARDARRREAYARRARACYQERLSSAISMRRFRAVVLASVGGA
jgi:glycosyltransferase involved in cell wall biosynthesis